MFETLHFVHYIPIATTLLSAIFFAILLRHYLKYGKKPYVAWWAAGVFTYGLGTLLEATITLHGNTILLTKLWYVFGAIFGGYPLAQGSAYLHLSRRAANISSAITVPFIIFASVMVFISPADATKMLEFKPSGSVLEWQWVRLLTPFINLYAVFFLIGGAIYSSVKYFKSKQLLNRAKGNALIAFGAILPGIGGTLAKAGYVEALYIGEFLGIIFIYMGYKMCISDKADISK